MNTLKITKKRYMTENGIEEVVVGVINTIAFEYLGMFGVQD
jgi:hypothetical protein